MTGSVPPETPPAQHLFSDHNPPYPPPRASSSRTNSRPPPSSHPVSVPPKLDTLNSSSLQTTPHRNISASPPPAVPNKGSPGPPHTPKRQPRNPIHPALASPPSSPPQGPLGGSPYEVRSLETQWKQSYSIPVGLNSVAGPAAKPNGELNRSAGSSSALQGSRQGSRAVSSSMTAPNNINLSGLGAALPQLPKLISNVSGRFADADDPSLAAKKFSSPLEYSNNARSPPVSASRRSTSAAKSPPVSVRTPRYSDVTPRSSASPSDPRNALTPPVPHTRTSYFPQTSELKAASTSQAPTQNGRNPYDTTSGGTMSEASAYALAMKQQKSPQGPLSPVTPIERTNTSSAPPAPDRPQTQRKSSRPLPRPPGPPSPPSQTETVNVIAPKDGVRSRVASGQTVSSTKSDTTIIGPPKLNGVPQPPPLANGHANPGPGAAPVKISKTSPEKVRPTVVIPDSGPQDRRLSSKPYQFDFPRSPTLPPLNDPRGDTRSQPKQEPVDKWAAAHSAPARVPTRVSPPPSKRASVGPPIARPIASGPPTESPAMANGTPPALVSSQLPTRRTSVVPPVGGMPSAVPSAVFTSPTTMTPASATAQMPKMARKSTGPSNRPPPSTRLKRNGRPTLAYVIAHPDVQSALLPYLTINSFLSLTGCSELIRKQLSGELVGRWILKEWGLQVDREKGRSWPNLTVWEGFRECRNVNCGLTD